MNEHTHSNTWFSSAIWIYVHYYFLILYTSAWFNGILICKSTRSLEAVHMPKPQQRYLWGLNLYHHCGEGEKASCTLVWADNFFGWKYSFVLIYLFLGEFGQFFDWLCLVIYNLLGDFENIIFKKLIENFQIRFLLHIKSISNIKI